nr:hypothetical protein [uncultured Desulfobacter sp.]
MKVFQLEFGISEETIQTAALQGGGKAPEGVCGALHAVRVILGSGSALEEIENDFSAKAGSKQCREIRGMRSLPCSGCVTLSAYLLEQHIDEVKAGNPNIFWRSASHCEL